VGAADQEGSPVELLLLVEFESCSYVGGGRLRIVTLLECRQFASGWGGSYPIWLGFAVAKGRDG